MAARIGPTFTFVWGVSLLQVSSVQQPAVFALKLTVTLCLGDYVLLMKKLYFLKEKVFLFKPDSPALCFCVWGRDRCKVLIPFLLPLI